MGRVCSTLNLCCENVDDANTIYDDYKSNRSNQSLLGLQQFLTGKEHKRQYDD